MHLVEGVGGVFEGPAANVGTYVVVDGELEGVTDVLTRAGGGADKVTARPDQVHRAHGDLTRRGS